MHKTKTFGDSIKWLIETYAEFRSEQADHVTHRVVDYFQNEKGEYEIFIQCIGKSLSFKTSPKEVMTNDSMLESFSKKDIRLLTYLACENVKEPRHEVIGQKFVRSMNRFVFKLKYGKTGQEIEKSAEEISIDPTLIKSLTPEDAHKIGYVTANEQIKQEMQKQCN